MIKRPRIVIIGSANTDMVVRLPRIPKPGETVGEGLFSRSQGGKGANQCVAAARAGGDVSLIACVGADPFGQGAINQLAQEGIHVEHIHVISGTPTGVALITVDRFGENAISLAPGANERLSPAHIDAAEARFAEAAMVLVQLEIPFDTACYAIRKAHSLGVPVLFNPAPAREMPREILALVDTLVMNSLEAGLICKRPLNRHEDRIQAAQQLRSMGARRVVISMGARGALLSDEAGTEIIPSFPVTPVDTTGAGDVLCGTLAVRLADGDTMRQAMRFASAAASLSVAKSGSQTSAPERLMIRNFLELHGG